MINDKFIFLNQYGEVSMYFASLNMLQMGMFLLKQAKHAHLG
jgi:hypothetical protein